MKKILSIYIMLLLGANLFGQVRNFGDIPKDILEHLDKMGVDDSSLLNCYESVYFNVIFEKSRKDFDFTGKKIGFITGSSGKTKSSKANYFAEEKERFYRNSTIINSILYIFNETQKEESGGYDAVVVYWCKVLLRIEDLPKKLKK